MANWFLENNPMSEQDTGQAGLIVPSEMKFVSKSWGWELWICNNQKYCGKKLFIKQGHHLSYHRHNVKDEVLFVESGRMWFTHSLEGEPQSIEMAAGYAFHVTPGIIHQMQAIEDTVLYEFSTQHFDEDSYRITRDLVTVKK
jgi:mannose-6-phosphate isomerase-like protein (cupin superfamily)